MKQPKPVIDDNTHSIWKSFIFKNNLQVISLILSLEGFVVQLPNFIICCFCLLRVILLWLVRLHELTSLLYLVYACHIFCLPNCVYFVESIFMLIVNLGMLGLLRFIMYILITHCFPRFLACNVCCSAFIQYGSNSATDLRSVRPEPEPLDRARTRFSTKIGSITNLYTLHHKLLRHVSSICKINKSCTKSSIQM